MGQTNSAHEIAEHDDIEDAAVAGLKLNLRDCRRGYGDWDHTVIWCGPLADMPESMRRQLMRGRHLVLRRSSDLAERDILLLQGMLAHLPRLKDAYEAKEAFCDWYDVRGVDAAREALEAWKASVPRSVRPAFGALLTALGNWEEEILAFFEHRATNAYVESLNHVIRAINRMGRGYSFSAIRAKVLYGHGRRRQRPLFSAVMDRSLDYMSHMVVPSPEGDLGVPSSTLLAVADHEDSPT